MELKTEISIIKDENYKQKCFIFSLLKKYKCDHLLNIYPSKHFTQRLIKDRRDEVLIDDFNLIISKLIKNNVCQLLYTMELHGDGAILAIKSGHITMICCVMDGAEGTYNLMIRTIYPYEPLRVDDFIEL